MKKTLIILVMVLLAAMLVVSCANEPSKYTVSFDLNGGSGDVPDSQTVVDGEKATKPTTDPTPANTTYYEFAYWAKEGETTEFDFSKGITSDTRLVAKWKDKYEVGDTGPAGGKIFYVVPDSEGTKTSTWGSDSYTWKYLEVATSNASIGADSQGRYVWYKNSEVECTTGTGIGSGWSNMQEIKSKDNYSTNFPAAYACETYGTSGQVNDWFLPSKDELLELYRQKDHIGTFSTSNYYWTSSMSSDSSVYTISLGNGGFDNASLYYDRFVRPIRAF